MWQELDTEWAIGMAVIVGVVVAILAFLVGWYVINRRRARLRELAAQTDEWKEVTSPEDAFRYGMGMARRKSVRMSGNQIPVQVSPDASTEPPWEGWVLDRSQGGLRLRIEQAVEIGAILRVRSLRASESIPWVKVQVKNSRQRPEYWEAGCQFLTDLPPDVLRSFGST